MKAGKTRPLLLLLLGLSCFTPSVSSGVRVQSPPPRDPPPAVSPTQISPAQSKEWTGRQKGPVAPNPPPPPIDTLSHPPPTSGLFAYSPPGQWMPGKIGFLGIGQSYVDPVFGSRITRLSNDYPNGGHSDIYARNGFWNADGTRVHWRNQDGCAIRNSATGAVTQSTNVPCSFHVQFDPSRADKLFYYNGPSLHEYDIDDGSNALVKTFPTTLETLGGSVDYIDQSGRYVVVAYGGAIHVWDKSENAIYAGTASQGISSGGWAGITPNGAYLVVANGAFYAYTLDHARNTIGPQRFLWNLCGDHGDIGSATNGHSYLVASECYDFSALWVIDIAVNNNGLENKTNEATRVAQRNSGRQILGLSPLDDLHLSCSTGDWCWVSIESTDDDFASQGPWRAYKSEIVAMNVLTFDVRRLAHHRSRSTDAGYYNGPRICAAWNGLKAMWASNYGYNAGGQGYSDLYTTTLAAGSAGTNAPR